MPSVTRKDAKAFSERWRMVNAAELDELRSTSIAQKATQLAALMASVEQMGWDEALKEGDEEVRERWNKLRTLLRA